MQVSQYRNFAILALCPFLLACLAMPNSCRLFGSLSPPNWLCEIFVLLLDNSYATTLDFHRIAQHNITCPDGVCLVWPTCRVKVEPTCKKYSLPLPVDSKMTLALFGVFVSLSRNCRLQRVNKVEQQQSPLIVYCARHNGSLAIQLTCSERERERERFESR